MLSFKQLRVKIDEVVKVSEKGSHLEITPHKYSPGKHEGTAISNRHDSNSYGSGGAGKVDAEIRKSLNDPEKNEAFKTADTYSKKNLGHGYDLHGEHPKSSLAKQYAIGKTYDVAASHSPEYKKAVFGDYQKHRPDIVKESGAHDYDSMVKASYHAVAHETGKQFDALPVKTQFHEGSMGYHNSGEMLRDIHAHKNMTVFRGGDPHEFLHKKDAKTGLNDTEKFRAVHDYFGHAVHGNQFGPKGEEVAWHAHHKLYSPLASVAMSAETRGQNSNVNYTHKNLDVMQEMEHHRKNKHDALKSGNVEAAQHHDAKTREAGEKWNYAKQASVALPSAMIHPHYNGDVPESVKHLIHDPEAKRSPVYDVHTDKHKLVPLAKHYNTSSHSSGEGGKLNAEGAHSDLQHIAKVHGYTSLSHNPFKE